MFVSRVISPESMGLHVRVLWRLGVHFHFLFAFSSLRMAVAAFFSAGLPRWQSFRCLLMCVLYFLQSLQVPILRFAFGPRHWPSVSWWRLRVLLRENSCLHLRHWGFSEVHISGTLGFLEVHISGTRQLSGAGARAAVSVPGVFSVKVF